MVTEWGPVPFDEAIDFFKDKVPMRMDDFVDLQKEARIRAFSVSNVTGMGALSDIKTSIAKALEEGLSFGDWKKLIGQTLLSYGIEGFRMETIFRSNIQTAYQVGHYQQMHDPDVLRDRPYWKYVAVMDERTRPEHAEWHDTVLPADDPWWDTHYPPNGYNCFPAGTLVRAESGDIPIEEIKPGTKILTHKGRYRMATNIHQSHHADDLIRITGEDGTSLTMTANHKVLTPRGWIEAQHLKKGDEILKAYLDDGRCYVPKSVLIDMYCVRKMPLRKIAYELDIAFRTVLRLFKKYEIPKRAFEETIRLQWVGNIKRRGDQIEFAYKKIAGKKHKTGAYLKCPVCETRFYAQKNEIARGRAWCSTECAATGGAYASSKNRVCAI